MKQGTIFHPKAREKYLQGQEKTILPRLIRPSIFTALWLLILLFCIGLAVSWGAQVPVYVSGTAAVVAYTDDDIRLVTFLPATYLNQLQPGQPVYLPLTADYTTFSITQVHPTLVSPDKAQQEIGPHLDLDRVLHQPAAVATAPFTLPPGQEALTYAGSLYPVQVQIGSRRLLSLLPGIGRFFEGI